MLEKPYSFQNKKLMLKNSMLEYTCSSLGKNLTLQSKNKTLQQMK